MNSALFPHPGGWQEIEYAVEKSLEVAGTLLVMQGLTRKLAELTTPPKSLGSASAGSADNNIDGTMADQAAHTTVTFKTLYLST